MDLQYNSVQPSNQELLEMNLLLQKQIEEIQNENQDIQREVYLLKNQVK